MKNQDFVKKVITKCQEIHPNLYHSVTKEDVDAFIGSVEWNLLNQIEFDYNMLKLFAMFKDAHTGYNSNIPFEDIGAYLYFTDGKVYLRQNDEFLQVENINGCPIKKVVEKFDELLNYETESRKNHMLPFKMANGYYYKMLGLATDKIVFSVEKENRETCEIEKRINEHKSPKNEESASRKRNCTSVPNYDYSVVNGNILRLNYRSCDNMQDYPFKRFCEDMKADLQDKKIEGVVVDLRGNGGGSSSVIMPFVNYVQQQDWPCVVLMDNGTFSSGVIAVVDFKEKCGAVLVGEDAGQGATHYGDCPPFELNGKAINCCTKFFDFSNVFGYKGTIKPDIYVQRTIEEIRSGKQTQQVRTAYETINKMIEEKRRDQLKIIE